MRCQLVESAFEHGRARLTFRDVDDVARDSEQLAAERHEQTLTLSSAGTEPLLVFIEEHPTPPAERDERCESGITFSLRARGLGRYTLVGGSVWSLPCPSEARADLHLHWSHDAAFGARPVPRFFHLVTWSSASASSDTQAFAAIADRSIARRCLDLVLLATSAADGGVLDVIVGATHDASPVVRGLLARLAPRLGLHGLEPLLALAGDQEDEVRASVAFGLARFASSWDEEDASPPPSVLGSGALRELSDRLIRAASDAERAPVIEALGSHREPGTSEMLNALLARDDVALRVAVIQILERRRYVSSVGRHLMDPHASVRAAAATALGVTTHPRDIRELVLATSDPDATVCVAATIALERIANRMCAQLRRDVTESVRGAMTAAMDTR